MSRLTKVHLTALLGIAGLMVLAHGELTGALSRPPAAVDSTSALARDRRDRSHQIAVWERAAGRDPDGALPLAQLAGLYLQRSRESGSYDDVLRAEAVARRSLSIRTNRNAKTFSTLVASLVAQHRFAEALPIARQMATMDRETPIHRAMLGEIEMELGEYASARASFDAVRGASELPGVAARLARWEELNGRDEVARRLLNATLLALMERVDVPAEQRAWFFLRLGEHELRLGRAGAARRAFERALERAPGDHRLLAAMARLEAARGKWSAAIAWGERSLGIAADPGTMTTLAEAYAARGDSAQARDLRRAIELTVSGANGTAHRAWSLFLLDHGGDVDRVARDVERELETRRDIYGYDLLAWTRYRQGRFDEAEGAARQALSLGTADAMLWYHAGIIAWARGDRKEARIRLARALRINPRVGRREVEHARALLAESRAGSGR